MSKSFSSSTYSVTGFSATTRLDFLRPCSNDKEEVNINTKSGKLTIFPDNSTGFQTPPLKNGYIKNTIDTEQSDIPKQRSVISLIQS